MKTFRGRARGLWEAQSKPSETKISFSWVTLLLLNKTCPVLILYLPRIFAHLHVTLYLVLLVKFHVTTTCICECVLNCRMRGKNCVDPDQMPHSVASGLGLLCLLRLVSPNT